VGCLCGIGRVERGEGEDNGRSSIVNGVASAEWKVAASDVTDMLDKDLLCQWVLSRERLVSLGGPAIVV
jgi:hypothetical protein